jgi:hypothetical protein
MYGSDWQLAVTPALFGDRPVILIASTVWLEIVEQESLLHRMRLWHSDERVSMPVQVDGLWPVNH